MSHERIKELKIDIIDNIEMISLNSPFTSLYELKQHIKKEPGFLEQFN